MESDTFLEGFMVKLIWRLSGNFIYHAFSMKTQDILRTNSIIKSLSKLSLSTLFPYHLHTNHSDN